MCEESTPKQLQCIKCDTFTLTTPADTQTYQTHAADATMSRILHYFTVFNKNVCRMYRSRNISVTDTIMSYYYYELLCRQLAGSVQWFQTSGSDFFKGHQVNLRSRQLVESRPSLQPQFEWHHWIFSRTPGDFNGHLMFFRRPANISNSFCGDQNRRTLLSLCQNLSRETERSTETNVKFNWKKPSVWTDLWFCRNVVS